METVTLEVFSVDDALAVGFRKIKPAGPAGERFGLYLPPKKEKLTTFGQLTDIAERKIIDNVLFTQEISFITIHDGDYNIDSVILLSQWMQDFRMSADCRISCPASLIYGGAL